MKQLIYTDLHGREYTAPEGTVPEMRVSVYAVVIHLGKVLMVRDIGSERWCLPGGRLEPGESYADCLCREGLEEAGYPITLQGKSPIFVPDTEGFRWEPTDRWFWSVKLYYRGVTGERIEGFVPPADEIAEVAWHELWRIRDLSKSENVRKAILAAQYGP